MGGADKGGIIVREGQPLASPAYVDRLSTGAEVEEVRLAGERMQFRRLTGAGPLEGWISLSISGKALAELVVLAAPTPAKEPPTPAPAVAPAAEPPKPAAAPDPLAPTRTDAPAAAAPAAAAPAAAAAAAGAAGAATGASAGTAAGASVGAAAGAAAGAATGAAAVVAGKGEQASWIEESRRKLQAYRDKTPVSPPDLNAAVIPSRLKEGRPQEKLPPHKRLTPAQMSEMSVKSLPGHFSGTKYPQNAEELEAFGASWYTAAFHKFGTLPKDNRVKRIVKVEQLPHSGFDAAGGAGHKAFVTLEYEKPDPNLHTELFAKFPWDYHESEGGKTYRMQISCYGDNDAPELLTYMCCEHLFPFRIPKLYFCDINRDTTNYMLIIERVPFGKRGKIQKGRIVEKIERNPFDVLPVCGKYQDYLLDDPAQIYFCLFREMAHLAAWDQQGHYDSHLGVAVKFTQEQFLTHTLPTRKPARARMKGIRMEAAGMLLSKGEEFATKIAPQVFTPRGKDPQMLKKMQEDIAWIAPYFDDIRTWLGSCSDWIAAMHPNLQADNAFFWKDEQGDMDCGVFDWSGFGRSPFVSNFMGCLSGAEADLLDAHEEGLLRMFCDEYKRYGGPDLDYKDMMLRYRLLWPAFVMDCCQWIERDILRECPLEEWPTVTGIHDDKFVDRWNVRCRGTTLINAFEFWPRRPFRTIVEDWVAGPGKPFLTEYTV